MADLRVQQPVKITDPTTNANEAGVTAGGALKVDITSQALSPVVTADNQTIADNAGFTDGTSKVLTAGYIFDETAGTALTENDAAAARVDSKRAQVLVIEDATTRGQRAAVSAGGALLVDTEMPAAAALADATANPTVPGVGAFAVGFNGTTWDRVRTANTGRLQVDVITGGGVDTPTNPLVSNLTTSALAAGSSANMDTADLASKKCWQVDVTGSVAWKAVISTLTNAAATTVTTLFGLAGQVVQWKPPHRNWATSGSSAGADGFRVAITNLDTSEAADFYATVYYSD